jgi:hypothetical protein
MNCYLYGRQDFHLNEGGLPRKHLDGLVLYNEFVDDNLEGKEAASIG